MLIRLLLLILLLILIAVAYFFQRQAEVFSQVLAGEHSPQALSAQLQLFGKVASILALIGLICLIFATKTLALLFLSVVMVVSAYFSISIAKLIKQ